MAVHVLLIQADVRCADLVRDALSKYTRYEIEWVQTCARGLERLNSGRQTTPIPPVSQSFSSTSAMPDGDGIDIVDRLYVACPAVPIVILSSA